MAHSATIDSSQLTIDDIVDCQMLTVNGLYMDNRASLRATVEFLDAFLGKPHNSCDFCMECPIFSQIGVFPRSEFRAFLPHDNSSRVHALAGKEFDATSLALAIPDVTGRTAGFLVGHSG